MDRLRADGGLAVNLYTVKRPHPTTPTLQRGMCWWCDKPLESTYTSVEGSTGLPLFVHYHCRPDAEVVTWPRRYA